MNDTIRVTLHPHGYLEALTPAGGLEIRAGLRVGDLAISLGIVGYHLGAILINDAPAKADRILADGDDVHFIPIVGGG